MQFSHIVGIDEVGRGPVAGPVAVGVFVAPPEFFIMLAEFLRNSKIPLRDSKKLTEKKREVWFEQVNIWQADRKCDYKVSMVSAEIVDSIGIVPAIKKAMGESLEYFNFDTNMVRVLLDGGLHAPEIFTIQETIIKGDEKEPAIALASIVAKVTRDRHMHELAKEYPEYGFENHVGYGTKVHYEAIKKHGMTGEHRRSFLRNL